MAAEYIHYENFDLLLSRGPDGYRAKVICSPAGEASEDFGLVIGQTELENLVLRMARGRRTNRGIEAQDASRAEALGRSLYEGVFRGEVRDCLGSSIRKVRDRNCGLRIRLRLDRGVTELNNLPWELLYDASRKRYLALNYDTPLVRYADIGDPIRPIAITPPLRVLVVLSSPAGLPPLNGDQEFQKITNAVGEIGRRGLIALRRLNRATLSDLRSELDAGTCHVLHFIGHGSFSEARGIGELIFEDEDGRACPVSADRVATIVSDHRALRLVVLNACEGARNSVSDPFGGIAQTLVLQDVPAVAAMQFEISDLAAITFSQTFYTELAKGRPVDQAVSAGRKAIFASQNEVEWATPVLYMRTPDGTIFSAAAEAAPADPPPREKPVSEPPLGRGPASLPAQREAAVPAAPPAPPGDPHGAGSPAAERPAMVSAASGTCVTRHGLIPAADATTAQRELAFFLGPIASVVVWRTAQKVTTTHELWDALAAHIEHAADRAAFLRNRPRERDQLLQEPRADGRGLQRC